MVDPAPHKHGTGARWHDRLALLEKGAPGRDRRCLAGRIVSAGPGPERDSKRVLTCWRFAAPEVVAAVAGLLADGRALPAGPARPRRPRRGHGRAVAARKPCRGDRHKPPPGSRGSTPALPRPVAARAHQRHSGRAPRPGREGPAQPLPDSRRAAARAGRRARNGRRSTPRSSACRPPTKWCAREHGYRWAKAGRSGCRPDDEIERLLAQFEGAAGVALLAAGATGRRPARRDAQRGSGGRGVGSRLATPRSWSMRWRARAGWSRSAKTSTIRPSGSKRLMGRLAAAMEAAGQIDPRRSPRPARHVAALRQALLEHMDSEGLTLRVGEARRLRRRRR